LLHIQQKYDDLRGEATKQQNNIRELEAERESLRRRVQVLRGVIAADRGRESRFVNNIQAALAEFYDDDVTDEEI
jgi:predicted  nucleic acid-binding Zn-ribbon protein